MKIIGGWGPFAVSVEEVMIMVPKTIYDDGWRTQILDGLAFVPQVSEQATFPVTTCQILHEKVPHMVRWVLGKWWYATWLRRRNQPFRLAPRADS